MMGSDNCRDLRQYDEDVWSICVRIFFEHYVRVIYKDWILDN